MKRTAVIIVIAGVLAGLAATAQSPAVSFHKDVEPILQKNCQTCHRPGQVAPMSFMTYENVRPYARAMKTAVLSRKMPPWFADSAEVDFLQDAELVYLMPHMHARGKDMTYSLEFPDGRKQVILNVPRYDF